MMQETGVGIKDPLFFIGVVENNVDGRYEGRVQVRAFGVHGTIEQVATKDLPWAHLIHGSYDPNGNIPPLNSFVFGFFVDGRDAQQPMILGLIPTQMTEIIDPTVSGWGVIPNGKSPARGSEPEDYGQPQNSKLARGENIDETYVLLQQLKRIKNVKNARGVDEEETTWSEPAPEYNTRYPFNRVIETDAHVIELDDTKDYERFMIYHKKNGSFVHIGPSGTTTHKASDDKYEMNEKAQHVYVGGKSNVTIVGDSRVYVQGNKIEEINGDYTQIIRGNHYMGVAGQMNFNSGDEIQLRSAKVRIEANVEGINLKGAKNLRMESGESTHIKSNIGLFLESTNTTNIKAGDNIYLDADSGIIHINANTVNIDDTISMANGNAGSATAATAPEATELPEPPAKGVSTTQHVNTPSKSGGGYVSQDATTPPPTDPPEADPYAGKKLTNAEIVGDNDNVAARAAAEKYLGRKLSDSDWQNLLAATVAESLPNSPQEQAAIMAVILNRVKSDRYPNSVMEVLLQTNQFQAVSGTSANGRQPSNNFLNPSTKQMASTVNGVNQYLNTYDQGWLNFTSNIDAAYGAGTDISFKDKVANSQGSKVIGGTVFGTV